MGREKSRLRLGGRTLLGHVRLAATSLGLPVRVIRRDLVPRCGPLGGIYTALKTSEAGAELFLACDTPFISATLLRQVVRRFRTSRGASFSTVDGLAGFPFVIEPSALPLIERQLKTKQFSLQALASSLKARLSPVPLKRRFELFNVNTPAEWEEARAHFRHGKVKAARSNKDAKLAPKRRFNQIAGRRPL